MDNINGLVIDKNLYSDYEPDILGFFDGFKQPSEKTVRQAMLWYTECPASGIRLSYKAGGGSLSDNDFSSSLTIKEKGDRVFVAGIKHKSCFKDVLLSPEVVTQKLGGRKNLIDKDSFYEDVAYAISAAVRFNYEKAGIPLVPETEAQNWMEFVTREHITVEDMEEAIRVAEQWHYDKASVIAVMQAIKTILTGDKNGSTCTNRMHAAKSISENQNINRK